jgi:hypothetical protein
VKRYRKAGRTFPRRMFLQGATFGVGSLFTRPACSSIVPTDSGIANPTSDSRASLPGVRSSRQSPANWLRCPRMYSTDPYFYSLTVELVDIRDTCRRIAEASGTIYRLSAHSNYGYVGFDSKYGIKQPGLGSQDWLAEAREACDRYGIKLIAYFGFDGYKPDHPSYGRFDARNEHGNPIGTEAGGFRNACLNWPGWHDLMLAILAEAARKYSLDGIYTDWMGYCTCYCESCRKKFQSECGLPIPDGGSLARSAVPFNYPGYDEGEDLIADTVAGKYAEWKSELTNAMIVKIQQTVRAVKPGILTLHHMHSNDKTLPYYAGTPTEGGDRNRPDWVWRTSMLANASNVYEVPSFINLYNNDGVPEQESELRAAEVFAHGCYPNVIPIPAPDSRPLAGASRVFHLVEKNHEYFDFNLNDRVRFLAWPCSTLGYGLVRDGLVAHSHPIGADGFLGESGQLLKTDRSSRGLPATEVDRFNSPHSGMFGALALSAIPVSSIEREHFLEQFSGFRVLCLANETSMSDPEVERVREFVDGGGGLIATHETSLYRQDGTKRADFALADVFGVRYAASDRYFGAVGGYRNHVEIKQHHPVNGSLPPSLRIRNVDLVVPIRLAGAKSIVSLVEPADVSEFTDSPGGHIGTLRDSLMAGSEVGPAITVHEFGKGRVVYFAGRPASIFLHWAMPEMREWIRNAVAWVSGGACPVRLGGDIPVSVSLFRQPQRYVLHLVNLSRPASPVDLIPPLRDVRVLVNVQPDWKPQRVRALVAAIDLEFHVAEDGVSFLVPEMQAYEVTGLEHFV